MPLGMDLPLRLHRELAARYVHPESPFDPELLLLGSFGALSVLSFATNSPLAAPRNTLAGHTVALCVAYTVHYASTAISAMYGTPPMPPTFEKVVSPATSIALMMQLKVRAVL